MSPERASAWAAFAIRDVLFPLAAVYGYFYPPGGTLSAWMLPMLAAFAGVPLAARGFRRGGAEVQGEDEEV